MSLWTAKAAKSLELDQLKARELTPEEAAEIRVAAQRAADESPFRCECLKCVLDRARRAGP